MPIFVSDGGDVRLNVVFRRLTKDGKAGMSVGIWMQTDRMGID